MKLPIAAVILSTLAISPGWSQESETGPDWVRVTEHAGWQARDSQGEVVYKNRLWIFGGWFQSFEAPPAMSGPRRTARPGNWSPMRPPGSTATCR